MARDVLVITGAGGMGQAIARRIGSGSQVLLADFNLEILTAAGERLRGDGFDVHLQPVDVSSRSSVHDLAARAAALGPVRRIVHTAGLSPVQAPAAAILAVDLVGVAFALEEFGDVVEPGGAGVVIASMAGHMAAPMAPDREAMLARTPADQLGLLPFALASEFANGGAAYSFAKRANALRVRAASVAWGARGARINSISPGIISTSMGRAELASPAGGSMRAMIDGSAARRLGTADEIAAAAEFLLGPGASFITGTDLLVDGGVVAALMTGHIDLGALMRPSDG
jgi:NAD(P)-dependent dehydrogenase (short-subunit alcohol dehydrogenase family)